MTRSVLAGKLVAVVTSQPVVTRFSESTTRPRQPMVRAALSVSPIQWWVVLIMILGAALTAEGHEPCIRFWDDLFLQNVLDRDPSEERIETDRHDFTQSTKTVGRLATQLEAGYTFYYKDDGQEIEDSHALPELQLRIGLTDDIEFRLRWNYVWQFIDGEDDLFGGQDLRWGFKLQVTEHAEWLPESALDLRFTAPIGANVWTTGQVEVGFDLIYGWQLDPYWSLSGSTGYWKNGLGDFSLLPVEAQGDNFNVWSQSIALGVELTARTTMFNEFFVLVSDGLADNYVLALYNIGVDYYFTDNLVGDIRIGKGLTEDTDDVFCGIGGGYRF